MLILGWQHREGGLLDRQNGKLAIALALFAHLGGAGHRGDLQRQPAGPHDRLPGRRHVLALAGRADRRLHRRARWRSPPPVLELLYSAYGFTGHLPREGMDPGQAPGRAAGDPDDGDRFSGIFTTR